MNAQLLEVSVARAETVLRLERGAWSMVKWLRQAANEYAFPPSSLLLVQKPAQHVRACPALLTPLPPRSFQYVVTRIVVAIPRQLLLDYATLPEFGFPDWNDISDLPPVASAPCVRSCCYTNRSVSVPETRNGK